MSIQRKNHICFGKVAEIFGHSDITLKGQDTGKFPSSIWIGNIVYQVGPKIVYLLRKADFVSLNYILKKDCIKQHVKIAPRLDIFRHNLRITTIRHILSQVSKKFCFFIGLQKFVGRNFMLSGFQNLSKIKWQYFYRYMPAGEMCREF